MSGLASTDVFDICDYYDQVSPDQAEDFLHDVELVKKDIVSFPYSRAEGMLRHRALRRYPYAAYYWLDDVNKIIWVTGIIHQRRDPSVAAARQPKHTAT